MAKFNTILISLPLLYFVVSLLYFLGQNKGKFLRVLASHLEGSLVFQKLIIKQVIFSRKILNLIPWQHASNGCKTETDGSLCEGQSLGYRVIKSTADASGALLMRNKQGRCPEKAHYLIKGTLSHIQHVLKQILKSLLHIFGNILRHVKVMEKVQC